MSYRRLTHALTLGAVTAALAFGGAAGAQADIHFEPAATVDVDAAHQLVGGIAHVSATAEFIDIPSSIYYLTVRDMTSGVDVAWCPSTNVCTASVQQNIVTTHTYRAQIVTASHALLTQSNAIDVMWSTPIVLNASPNWLFQGDQSILTAKSKYAGPIVVKDSQTGIVVGQCPAVTTTSCPVPVTNNVPSTHSYVATQAVGGGRATVTSNLDSVQWVKIVG